MVVDGAVQGHLEDEEVKTRKNRERPVRTSRGDARWDLPKGCEKFMGT